LISIFTREPKLVPQASTLKLLVVYAQVPPPLTELSLFIHTILQLTLFRSTNNPTYCLLTSVLSVL
jgi:hypothetical protein